MDWSLALYLWSDNASMENQEQNFCAYCAHQYQPTDAFCNTCGYPLQGKPQEQKHFIANRATKEIDLIALNKKIERACESLYWVAGILTVSFTFLYFVGPTQEDPTVFFLTAVIIIGAFLALGAWSKQKPAAAIISGLSLFVVLLLVDAIVQPSSIFSAFVFKILVIIFLVKGIMAIFEVEKIKKELNIK